MNSWWTRNLWKIVLFPTLAAVCIGGVAFCYAYLHNQAGFDKDGRRIDPTPGPGPAELPPVPRTPVGEAGLLVLVVDDLTRAGKEAAPHFRYLSVMHRHDDPAADAAQLIGDRQAIAELVAALSPPNTTATAVALDPARTVFRLDLRQLDWTADTWRDVTRDYPYGLRFDAADDRPLADAARELAALTEERLPVVRADWWVAALTRPPLSEPGGPGLTSKSPPTAVKATAEAHRNRVVDLSTAARELRATEAEVTELLRDGAELRQEFGLAPLLRPGGSIPRDAWESTANTASPFQELARRLHRGKPVVRR